MQVSLDNDIDNKNDKEMAIYRVFKKGKMAPDAYQNQGPSENSLSATVILFHNAHPAIVSI